MLVKVQCPNPSCRKAFSVAEDKIGLRARCQHCKQPFTLAALPADKPTLDGAAPAAQTVSPASKPSDSPGRLTRTAPSAVADSMPKQIGRFVIREALGEGAFGRVYRAHDPQLDREVALKVARPEKLTDAKRVERFLREARATAQLRHPHIVPVYDAGCDGGYHYIAAAFIRGDTLEKLIETKRPDFRRSAQLARQLAEALAYAHEQGIVHRDVKPANVMVDEKGQPMLMDFGLAARLEGEAKLTQDGAVLGTPAYIAPEQAKGQEGEARPASDQYSLGVVLYELLCGKTPFAGPVEVVIFNQINVEPKSPRQVRSTVPRDLETICLKCLEKDAERRYADCQELADDLRRWLDGEAIEARRMGLAERISRWVKKEPRLAGALTAAVACLFTVAVVLAVSGAQQASLTETAQEEAAKARRAQQDMEAARTESDTIRGKAADALRQAEESRKKADDARAKTESALAEAERVRHEAGAVRAQIEEEKRKLQAAVDAVESERKKVQRAESRIRRNEYCNLLLQAQSKLASQDTVGALKLLGECPDEYRGWEWGHLLLWAETGKRSLSAFDNSLRGGPVISPDGARFATVNDIVRNGAISEGEASGKVCDARTGQTLFSIKGHKQGVWQLEFSPDGKYLVSSGLGEDYKVIVWDVQNGRALRVLTGAQFSVDDENDPDAVWGDGGGAIRVAFSPDGRRLIAHSMNGKKYPKFKMWGVASGKEILAVGPCGYETVFSPDGKRVVCWLKGNRFRVWDAATGKEISTLAEKTGRAQIMVFSPDSRHLATSSDGLTVRVWDAETGQVEVVLNGNGGSVKSVAFRPDGKRLVTSYYEKSMKVWDAATGKEILTVMGYSGGNVSFSSNGKQLVEVAGHKLTVWDAATGLEAFTICGPTTHRRA